MEIERLSHSTANSLATCGWSVYLKKEMEIPTRPSVAAMAGNVVHSASEAIDRYLWECHPSTLTHSSTRAVLRDLALSAAEAASDVCLKEAEETHPDRSSWKTYGRPTAAKPHGEDWDWFASVAIPFCLDNYIDWRLANRNLKLYELDGEPAIEVPFTIQIGPKRPIHGYIDRVFIDTDADNKTLVVDLKTGKKPDTSEQLGIYKLALEERTGQSFPWGAFVYEMKKGQKVTPPIDLSHYTKESLAYKFSVVDRMIDGKLYLPRPGEHCFHCDVSASCDFVKACI